MNKGYRVEQYSKSLLCDILSINTPKKVIENKKQFDCLCNYLEFLDVKTIVIEFEYIDRDFLDDYAGYYVRCFKEYEKKCIRLHFFNINFDEKKFEDVLSGDSEDFSSHQLQNSYKGFSVIKPLPRTIIGRTCLATYPHDGFRRHYPVTRKYDINLFGINLYINSLAFQEQDAVVSACATSALWSTLQGTGTLFQHNIPSPMEITTTATQTIEYRPPQTRLIPNPGLTIDQMAQAIKQFQLDPLIISAIDEQILKGHVYAYINSGLPLLLCINIYNKGKEELELYSAHAITLTGYSLGCSQANPWNNCLLESSKIDELYAHDDNVGPFSKIGINLEKVDPQNPNKDYPILDIETKKSNQVIIPSEVIIPLYHKIRIPYNYIFNVVFGFDRILKVFQTNNFINLPENLTWDIYLTTINKYKTELFNSQEINNETKRLILTKRLPRFLWKATAFSANETIFEFLFDATDIQQADAAVNGYVHDDNLLNQIKAPLDEDFIQEEFINVPHWQIIKWFREQNYQ